TTLGTLWPTVDFPTTNAFVAIGTFTLATVVALRRGSTRGRRYLLACLALAGGSYLPIAIGRAPFYRLNAILVGNTDRYQYVGPILFTICWCVGRSEIGRWVRILPALRLPLLLLALAPYVRAQFTLPWRPVFQYNYSRNETTTVVSKILARIAEAPRGD